MSQRLCYIYSTIMTAVLTVDDSPSIRQMIKVVLGPAGHTVIEAGDGAQGNGIELIKALRALPSLPGLPSYS